MIVILSGYLKTKQFTPCRERRSLRMESNEAGCIGKAARRFRQRWEAGKRSDMSTLSNVETGRGQANPPSVRVAPDTIPEAKSSQTGVSVRYVPTPDKHWFVFRASYGREDRAKDYIVADGTFVYIAKRYARKTVNGRQKKVLETLIPNLLFVYTTDEKASEYIKNAPPYPFYPIIITISNSTRIIRTHR